MKRGVWIGVVIGVVIILTGTLLFLGRNKTVAPTSTTLTVWSPFDEGKTFQTISAKWLAAHPTVTLNFKYIQATDAKDYEAQVVNAIANGTGPDIWLARSDWLPKHTDKLSPANSNGSAAAAITLVKQNIIPNLVDQNVVGKALYGMPLSADALAIIYNQTLYSSITADMTGDQAKLAETVPGSWADLKKQVNLVSTTKNGVVTRSGLAMGTSTNTFAANDVLSAFLVQNGVTNIMSVDGKSVAFNLPKIVAGQTTLPATEALAFFTSFSSPGASNFSWTENLGDPISAFMNQKTVALVGYFSTLQTIINKNPSFSINVSPLVQANPTPTSARTDYGVTWSGVVSKTSKQTSLAWNYLSFLGNPDVLQQYAKATNRLDISSSGAAVNLQPELVSSSGADVLYEQELPTITSLATPEWQFRDQVLTDTINLVVQSGQSVQTAIDSAAARFKTQFASGG